MKEWNATLIERIHDAATQEEMVAIMDFVKSTGYLRYNVDFSQCKAEDFAALAFEDQKKILLDCLDINHLYVNYGDMQDEAYKLSDYDLRLNHAFYEDKV